MSENTGVFSQEQTEMFGIARLAAEQHYLAPPSLAEALVNTVVALCEEYGKDDDKDGFYRPLGQGETAVNLRYNPDSSELSDISVPTSELVCAGNVLRYRKPKKPTGLPIGLYDFRHTLYVPRDSETVMILRILESKWLLRSDERVYKTTAKPAITGEVNRALDQINVAVRQEGRWPVEPVAFLPGLDLR
jgi:hypothetical protein